MNYSGTLSPSLHNEFRFGWTWFPTTFDIPFTENLNKQFGIKGAPVTASETVDFIASKSFWMPWLEGHYPQLRFEAFNFTDTP